MLSTGELYTKKICPQCGEEFETRKHNKKYCSKQCCTKITNKAILERYHANKGSKKNRECASCPVILSQYNKGSLCSSCERKQKDIERVNLLKELGFFDYESE